MTIYLTEPEAFRSATDHITTLRLAGTPHTGLRILREGDGFKVLIVPVPLSSLPYYL